MKQIGATAILCLVSAAAFSAGAVLDFKGFAMGARVEAFKQKFPSFQCKPTEDEQISCDSYRETYAGVHADFLAVFFVDKKLRSFQVDGVGEEKRSRTLAAMKEKYGEPRIDEKQTMHWALSNGDCRLSSGPAPQFQVVCVSNVGALKDARPAKNDI